MFYMFRKERARKKQTRTVAWPTKNLAKTGFVSFLNCALNTARLGSFNTRTSKLKCKVI